MLVLRRKLGEVIRIGTGVTVRVLEFRGNQVHLGLEAPPEVKIFREEVYRAMQREEQERVFQNEATQTLTAARHLE
jgi:carbon storage regulator